MNTENADSFDPLGSQAVTDSAPESEGAPTAFTVDALRAWLVSQGFSASTNPLRGEHEECGWYAYRRSPLPARECECNEGKPAQIVVTPHVYRHSSGFRSESVDIDVTGKFGWWWKLQAYGLAVEEVPSQIAAIERMLIAAWNALDVKETP